jgi:hypothetical protein
VAECVAHIASKTKNIVFSALCPADVIVTPPAIQLQSRQLLGRIQPFCDATTEDSAVTFTGDRIAAFRPKLKASYSHRTALLLPDLRSCNDCFRKGMKLSEAYMSRPD